MRIALIHPSISEGEYINNNKGTLREKEYREEEHLWVNELTNERDLERESDE